MFLDLEKVYIDGVEYKILSSRVSSEVFLALSGIADRNAAETYRNKEVYALKDDLPLEEDRWFIVDILGCAVSFEDGSVLGKVSDITTRGSTDIFTVDCISGKHVMFPFIEDLVVSVDIEGKSIIIKKSRFAEVCLYED